MGDERWRWIRQQPDEVVGRTLTGLLILTMGVWGLMLTPSPPPPQAALKQVSGQVENVEIDDDWWRGPIGVAFELEDQSGRRHRFYLTDVGGTIQSISDRLTYSSRSIFEPEVIVGYQDGDPEDELTVFELTISGERLANYPEIAEIQRFGARFVPPFSMIFVVAGLWLLISAFRISSADRVNRPPRPPAVRGPRLYRRLGLHHVFGPADRWFN